MVDYPADATTADLGPFWTAYNAIRAEHDRGGTYTTAADFWGAYHDKLTETATQLTQKLSDLQANTGWGDNASAAAFHQHMSAGRDSITTAANGATGIQQQWRTLTDQLNTTFQQADSDKAWLLQQQRFTGTKSNLVFDGAQQITQGDTGAVKVTPDVATMIKQMTTKVQGEQTKLGQRFATVAAALRAMPDPQWAGPHSPSVGAGPGTSASLAGKGTSAAPGGKQAGGGGGAGKTPSTGAGGSGDTSQSTTDPSTGTDPSGSSSDLGGDSSSLPPTSPDPTLAGSPTATLPPPTTTDPTGGISGSTTTPPGANSGLGLGSSNPPTVAPLTFPTLSSGASPPPARSGEEMPVGAVDDAMVDTPAAAETAATKSAGGGFYPPMMPPMYPGGYGQNGVQPGEADGAGGPAIRWRGRDSTRAGLVPELQGRGGRDDEPDDDPIRPSLDDHVLDEELWQVSTFASPVAPPDVRRPRSRGF